MRVTANAFLRRMVRSIVALLIEAGRGRLDPTAVEALLAARGRALSGRAAPARGLTLERVIYSNTGRARTSVPRGHNPEEDQEEQQT
jgi:tRNA pseudouridine38-40 synthase